MAQTTTPQAKTERLKQAIIEKTKLLLPELRECSAIGGRFNIDQLENQTVRMPAVLIGILKSPVVQSADGSVDINANLAAFCLTEGREDRRDPACWVIAEAMAASLGSTKHWGIGGIGAPKNIDIEPVLSAKTRGSGITLIAVTFSSVIHNVNEGVFTDKGHVPTELYVNDALEDSHNGVQP